jgi:hypothetical protein
MTSRITLNVFSGRPNPTWLLNDSEEDQLADRLRSSQELTERRPSGAFGGLGYRGFSITRDAAHPQGPLSMMVHQGIVDQQSGGANVIASPGLETWLAQTGQAYIPDVVQDHLRSAIAAPAPFAFPTGALVTCPPCHAADAPTYNPGAWNIPTVQPYNNCYNYANDHATNTFAQPGRATGHMYTALTCASVQPAAQSDGLTAAANFSAPLAAGKGWYVALVIWPNADYHWYRQDKVGCWSHKPGSTAVRNVDNAGQPITDPRTCNRGPYTVFCTYMVTTRAVRIS